MTFILIETIKVALSVVSRAYFIRKKLAGHETDLILTGKQPCLPHNNKLSLGDYSRKTRPVLSEAIMGAEIRAVKNQLNPDTSSGSQRPVTQVSPEENNHAALYS